MLTDRLAFAFTIATRRNHISIQTYNQEKGKQLLCYFKTISRKPENVQSLGCVMTKKGPNQREGQKSVKISSRLLKTKKSYNELESEH